MFSWMDHTSFMKPSCMPVVLDEFSMNSIFKDIEQNHIEQIFSLRSLSSHFIMLATRSLTHILSVMSHLFK